MSVCELNLFFHTQSFSFITVSAQISCGYICFGVLEFVPCNYLVILNVRIRYLNYKDCTGKKLFL